MFSFAHRAAICVSLAILAMPISGGASALTNKECSAKYKAAHSAGTLGGMKWAEFRKTQCEGAATTASVSDKAAKDTSSKPLPAPTKGSAVFPGAISAKYASESAGRARMHTCRDQYQANKATNGNGGLKWIMKGGGYYSECNKRLKS